MILEARNITFAYHRAHPIFKDFNLKIEQGSYWGVLGKNGAGKSTLLDLLNRVRTPQSGEIVYGEQINHDASKIFLLSHAIDLNLNLSIQEFFNFHSKFYLSYSSHEEKRLIDAFKLKPTLKLTALSTGQKKQVQAIAGLASQPEVLLLDEITAVLDPDARDTFFQLLAEINKKNKTTIILATNIREDLEDKISHLLYLKDDRYEVFSNEQLKQIFK